MVTGETARDEPRALPRRGDSASGKRRDQVWQSTTKTVNFPEKMGDVSRPVAGLSFLEKGWLVMSGWACNLNAGGGPGKTLYVDVGQARLGVEKDMPDFFFNMVTLPH